MGIKRQQVDCESNANLVSLFARRFGAGQWSFLGLGSERKWSSIGDDSPQGEWDKMAEKMMLTFAESGHPVFRPEVSSKAKAMDNYRFTLRRFGND